MMFVRGTGEEKRAIDGERQEWRSERGAEREGDRNIFRSRVAVFPH